MAVNRMGTETANLGANVLQDMYLEKVFVSKLKKTLIAASLGRQSSLPDNTGKKVRWQFMSLPSAQTTALATEGGDPPNSTDFTTTKAEATLSEYAGFTDYSKFLLKTALSQTLEEFVDGNGYQAALTIDTLVLGEVDNSTTTVDSGGALTADAIRQGAAKLAAVDAKFHRITGGKFYCMLASSEAAYDLMGEGAPSWFQVKSRDYFDALVSPFDNSPAASAIYNVIIKLTNNIQRDTTPSPDDDLNVMVADDAFGIASLDANVMQPRVIITRPEDLYSAPVRNRGTAGWWFLFAQKLFDNNRVAVIKSDATGVG